MNIMEQYRKLATTAFTKFYPGKEKESEDSLHAISLASSVMMTRDRVLMGGSFVQSVIDNDLEQAVSRADATAIKNLPFFVYCKKYVHRD